VSCNYNCGGWQVKSIIIGSILLVGFVFLNAFPDALGQPILYDDGLILEEYVKEMGWGYTTMTFVGDDILLLQKSGSVNLIRNGVMHEKPVLEVTVDPNRESGLLGVTSVGSTVYLYFTEADQKGEQLGNRIYKYDWNGEALINPVLIKELPSNTYHNSGAMVTGLDNQVYAVVGDTGIYGPLQNKTLENIFPIGTSDYMDTSVILKVDPEGSYQAMGIRNSFGLAIDPVTGNLWATENGDDDFDEINLISDKLNGGWEKIMGPATESELASLPGYEDYIYSDPEFSWQKVVAPAGINFAKFKETSNYDDSLFVGDCNNGNLYKFELNENRDGFEFSDPDLQDNLVNKNDSMKEIIIGTGFRCITDIERGPDGFLYLISHGERTIYRILPVESLTSNEQISKNESNSKGGGCLIATAAYGSELAPQVQLLREIRDNAVMSTAPGAAFMTGFNQLYYSFSPTIADMERNNPMFQEMVRVFITPMVSTLSIMTLAEVGNDAEVLGLGISVIILNLGMYIAAPVVVVFKVQRCFTSKK